MPTDRRISPSVTPHWAWPALRTCCAGLLHGVSPLDPLTFIRVPVVLAAVGLLASWLPARRAPVRVDPMFALRQE